MKHAEHHGSHHQVPRLIPGLALAGLVAALPGCAWWKDPLPSEPTREYVGRIVQVDEVAGGHEVLFELSSLRYRVEDPEVAARARSLAGTGRPVRALLDPETVPVTKGPDQLDRPRVLIRDLEAIGDRPDRD